MVVPTDIPTYASACSGSARYSSGCSCAGATAATFTAAAPTIPAPVFPAIHFTQYEGGSSDCASGSQTDTLVRVDNCIITNGSDRAKLSSFSPGIVSGKCFVNFYGSGDTSCVTTPTSVVAVTSNTCYDFNDVAAIKMVCNC
ncbi:hypothetical protein ABW20_dc0105977 [Dactylellina cionopaga]|nr:hypothetical protein ABW20_dc0105977 [Dactylellina cionopaga]